MHPPMLDPIKTPEELKAVCARMQTASDQFYRQAIQTGCHPWIEITGFLNEYIKVCQRAANDGVDFTEASIHSGKKLPMESFEAAYLGEKFGCMFDTSLGRDPKMLTAFLLSAFEEKVVVEMARLVLKGK